MSDFDTILVGICRTAEWLRVNNQPDLAVVFEKLAEHIRDIKATEVQN